MRIRDYYNTLVASTMHSAVRGARRGHPRYDEARRDYTEAIRAQVRL